jgi:ElaB/YqjD/DUF883 family membrane-anchored ribosome-binding protein
MDEEDAMAADGGGLISALARRVEDWREEAEDHGRDHARRAGRHLEATRDEAWRRGGRAVSRLRHRGGERLSDLRHRGDDARDELRRLWSQIEELVENEVAPRASGYGRTARRYAVEGRERALEAADYLRDATRSRPLLAIGVAVAATWLVASLMRRSRD